MTETIGWPRAREMKVEERNKELKERLISRWNDQRGISEYRDVRKILLDIVPGDGSGLASALHRFKNGNAAGAIEVITKVRDRLIAHGGWAASHSQAQQPSGEIETLRETLATLKAENEMLREVLQEAAQICKDLDDEALAKEGRLACGAECAAAIADLAARMNVPFERAGSLSKENSND